MESNQTGLTVDKQSDKLQFKEQVSDDNKGEMKKHDYHREIIDKQYDELAPNYEELYLRAGWNDPRECAELCKDTIEHLTDDLKN